ncbi:uncharacterized protein FOMMEDRAFT_59801, partial [Fomitiporia mediterranea MF3/22]|uniref:uncharacterized protein n=1 Tax=Fomitiporia mediterranea (strain MF3/22) TaxID=694068 RepID=UPI0004407D7A
IFFWKRQNAGHHLPPGPSPDFLIGHARKLPLTLPWITYSKWKHEYVGDVIYTYALGRSIVILNSFVAARDLLEKKSATFSDR